MEDTEIESCCKLDDAAAAIGGLTEMMCLKRQQQQQRPEYDATESPGLGRQVLQPASSPICTKLAHVKVYSYYEIDHTKLQSAAPDLLKSTRVVMVSEKRKNRVVVRFPSVHSLRANLSKSKVEVKTMMPSLDEKYAMEPEEAVEVLYRRVPPDEIGENRNLMGFWFASKKGLCWSELKGSGMLTWGKRKKVQFLGHNEEEEEEEGEEEDIVEQSRKRKRHVFTSCNRSSKLEKKKKKKLLKNSSDRWSKERYKLAEVNMLKILREKGAVYGKPILRPALRTEARKLIGDTGLLDHLLKHMAGKVAPGGQERFRRRHNADGAMEYWLESADLINIRKEAGVQDPYWTPPPGWNPGDNPTQDPVCAREFKQLKYDMTQMRRDIQELSSKKLEDDLAAVTTPSSCVSTTQNFEQDSFLLPLKEMYTDLMNKKAKIEEQMMEISHSLIGIEKEMEKLKSSVEENNKQVEPAPTTSLLPVGSAIAPPLGTEKETKDVERKKKEMVIISDGKPEDDKGGGKTTTVPPSTKKATAAEDKAAKIERLKSGFRICRPQGTFLWPDMATSPQAKVVVPLEELFVVPTPPSVSSSTTSGHHLLSPLPQCGPLPTSPVKPLPEKRPVTGTLSTAVSKPFDPLPIASITQFVENTSTAVTVTTSSKTSLINLNVVPNTGNGNGSLGSHSPSNVPTSPLAYQRIHHNKTTTSAVPSVEGEKRDILMECEQKRRGSSSTTMGVGTWLALATPNPPLDSNSRRG